MSVVGDIMSVKDALETEKENILSTSTQINSVIKSGLAWLKTNEDTFGSDLTSALSTLSSEFSAPSLSDFETAIEGISSDLDSELDSILSSLYTIKDDLDPAQTIDSLLGEIPEIPALPGLPGLNASVFQSILSTLLGDHFSLSLKDLPSSPGQAPSDGGATSGNATDITGLLFSTFESQLESFFSTYSSELDSMKASLETYAEKNIASSLDTNVAAAVENLLASKSAITTDLIKTQFQTLVSSELTSAFNVGQSLFTSLQSDLSTVRKMFDDILTNPLDSTEPLSELYMDLTGLSSPPTLLEVVSYVLAIPLTLSAQAATGSNLTFPNTPFQTFDQTTKTEMLASLQLLDIVISIGNKAYNYYQDKYGNPVSYQYKIMMGVIGSIQSGLSQAAFYPDKNGFFSGVTKDNALWGIQCFTGFGLSLIKWIMGAYWSYQNKDQNNLEALQQKSNEIKSEFDQILEAFNTKYEEVAEKIETKLPSFTTVNTDYLTELNADLSNIYTWFTGASSDYTKGFNELKTLTFDSDSIKKNISAVSNSVVSVQFPKGTFAKKSDRRNFLMVLMDDSDNLLSYQNSFLRLETSFAVFQEFAAKVEPELQTKEQNSSNQSKLMDAIFPSFDIVLQLLTLEWKLLLAKSGGTLVSTTTAKVVFSTLLSVISDAIGLYYYNNPPGSDSKAQKGKDYMNNAIFVVSKFYEFMLAMDNLDMGVSITKVKATDNPSLTVEFNFDVSAASLTNSFTITGASGNQAISSVVPGSDKSSFTVTLGETLVNGSYTISTVESVFTGPMGKSVTASKNFTIPASNS